MNKLTKQKRNQLILVALATILAIGALWMGLIRGQQETLQTIKSSILATEGRIEDINQLVKRADQITTNLQQAGHQLATCEKRMASGDLQAWIYNTINNFKTNYAVVIPSITQHIEEDCSLLPGFPYRQARVSLQGTGLYHDLGQFIAGFENNYPHIRFHNLEISPAASFIAFGEKEQLDGGQRENLSFKLDIVALVKDSAP